MGRLGLLVESWRRGHAPEFLAPGSNVSAYGAYTGLAIADPKAPFELKALGPADWAMQVAVASTVLYIADPLRLREGGWDDTWYGWGNPMLSVTEDWYDRSVDTVHRWLNPSAPWWLGAIDE
jgi:hypothetical protein